MRTMLLALLAVFAVAPCSAAQVTPQVSPHICNDTIAPIFSFRPDTVTKLAPSGQAIVIKKIGPSSIFLRLVSCGVQQFSDTAHFFATSGGVGFGTISHPFPVIGGTIHDTITKTDTIITIIPAIHDTVIKTVAAIHDTVTVATHDTSITLNGQVQFIYRGYEEVINEQTLQTVGWIKKSTDGTYAAYLGMMMNQPLAPSFVSYDTAVANLLRAPPIATDTAVATSSTYHAVPGTSFILPPQPGDSAQKIYEVGFGWVPMWFESTNVIPEIFVGIARRQTVGYAVRCLMSGLANLIPTETAAASLPEAAALCASEFKNSMVSVVARTPVAAPALLKKKKP